MKPILASACIAAMAVLASAATAQSAQPSQTTETFGAWTVRCVNSADAAGGKACEVVHAVAGQGGTIAQMAIGRTPGSDQTLMVVSTPLGIMLAKPVELAGASADDAGPVELAYTTCLASGCLAQTVTTPDELATLASGDGFTIAIYERTGRRIEIAMPSDGLAAALARLGLDAGQ